VCSGHIAILYRPWERLTHLNILRGWTTFECFHSVGYVDAFYRSVHFSSCLAILRSSLIDRQLIKHGWSVAQFLSAADSAFYKHRDPLLEYFFIYYCYYRLVLEQWWRIMYSWWVSPAYNTHVFPIAIWWPFPTGGTPIMTYKFYMLHRWYLSYYTCITNSTVK
jgi:hypothetical protein